MNKFKKLLSSVMAAALFLSAAPFGEFAEIDTSAFSGIKVFAADAETPEWNFNEEIGTLTIGADVSDYDFVDELISNGSKIKTINLDENNKHFKLIDGVLYDANIETLLIYPTASDKKEYIMPDSVKTNYCFGYTYYSPFEAENLETLKIGANFLTETYTEILDSAEEMSEDIFGDFIDNTDLERGKRTKAAIVAFFVQSSDSYFPDFRYSPNTNLKEFTVSEKNPFFKVENGGLYCKYNDYKILMLQCIKNIDKLELTPDIVIGFNTPIVCCEINELVISDEFAEVAYDITKIINGFDDETIPELIGYSNMWLNGARVKKFTVSDTNKYLCAENGNLFFKDKKALIYVSLDTDQTFVELPVAEYLNIYGIGGSYQITFGAYEKADIRIHLPDEYLNGTVKSVFGGYPFNQQEGIMLFATMGNKICIENEESFIACTDMTVEEWNKQIESEREKAEKLYEDYKKSYENGEISESEFLALQKEIQLTKLYLCTFEICDGKHNFIETFTIDEVENTEIKFGESITLTANLGEAKFPEGCTIEWTVDGTGAEIQVSEDTLSCTIKCVDSGEVTVTAKVVDADGNTVKTESGEDAAASQTLTMNANFFVRVEAFFKYIWNLILNLFK